MPATPEPRVDLSVNPADEIKTTTCYMCACRCGIRVFLKDGKVRYIEGNRDHPVNKGVPTVVLGPGEAAQAHQTDEYASMERIRQSVAIYEDLIRDWCRL